MADFPLVRAFRLAALANLSATLSNGITVDTTPPPPPPPPPADPWNAPWNAAQSSLTTAGTTAQWTATTNVDCTFAWPSGYSPPSGLSLTTVDLRTVRVDQASTLAAGVYPFQIDATIVAAPPPPAPPTVTLQPADVSVQEPNGAAFEVAGTNYDTIQWLRTPPGGGTFSAISGAVNTIYATGATSVAADNARQFRAQLTGVGGTAFSNPATLTVTAAPPPPPPPPAPQGQYQYQQPYLFQTIGAVSEPTRIAGGGPFARNVSGMSPNYYFVTGGWLWTNPGGDWIDSSGVAQGSNHWVSFSANLASGSTAQADYALNCTTMVQYAQVNDTWLACILKCPGAPRAIAGLLWADQTKVPRIDVTYTDATTATLACRIVALMTTSTSDPITLFSDGLLPAIMEFERPTKAVSSATMRFRLTQHWGGASAASINLIKPTINSSPVTQGIAATAVGDAGLVGHPDVVVLHRYVDGATLNSFKAVGTGFSYAINNFDPIYYGISATSDPSKIPNTNSGVWFFGGGAGNTQLVTSTYTGEGFQPLMPGLGALRFYMPPGIAQDTGGPLVDGSWTGISGSGIRADVFLPAPHFGTLDDIYVRAYYRIGSKNGEQYAPTMIDRKQVVGANYPSPGPLVWTDHGGKCDITPSHDVSRGGYSGTSGGPMGWQARRSWSETTETQGGPIEGGWRVGWHNYDFLASGGNLPRGNYPHVYDLAATTQGVSADRYTGATDGGGVGGLRYANRWYCEVMRMKLNTITQEYPGFLEDGILQFWTDGRLTKTSSGLVFRQGPEGYKSRARAHYKQTVAADQSSSVRVSGFSTTGTGWVGALVRSNAGLGERGGSGYVAVVSRKDASTAVIGLMKLVQNAYTCVHLALTDPIAWADGDELTLEAVGTAPTSLTVRQNGTALTLKWYLNGTAINAPPSTNLQTGTSYADISDAGFQSGAIGVYAMNTREGAGLYLDSWRGGTIAAPSTYSDTFTYSDGDLDVVAGTSWGNHDTMAPFIVRSGKILAPRAPRTNYATDQLTTEQIGHRNIIFNFFHGGKTQTTIERTVFVTGFVCSLTYPGPMRLE